MYERFTDPARKAMQLANQVAQRLNHEYIRSEDILLGIIRLDSGVAVHVLKCLGLELGRILLEVEKVLQSQPEKHGQEVGPELPRPQGGHPAGRPTAEKHGQEVGPELPRVKKVIEYAIGEARDLGHDWVGTEHVLLGLMRDSEGVAGRVLRGLGLTLEGLRQEVARQVPPGPHRIQGGEVPPEAWHLPAEIHDAVAALNAQIEALNRQKEAALAEQDFEKAARLRDEVEKLRKERREFVRAARGT